MDEKCNKVLLGKHEQSRPVGRPRRRLDNTTTDFKETGREGVDWIHLAQNRDQ
jgi:hypothetical protein